MVNGKAKIDLNVAEFANFLPHKTSSWYAQILATVEEEFTGVQLNETSGVQLYPYRYEMSCTDFSKCYSFFVDKENEIIFKITLVDGTVLRDTKTPVKVRASDRERDFSRLLTHLSQVKFTEGIRHAHYGDESELPKIENKELTFESRLNESSLAVFKVNLPDLPEIENFTRYYSIELEYEDEKRELYTTYPYREPKKIDTPEEEKEKEWFKLEVQRPKDKWRFVWLKLTPAGKD